MADSPNARTSRRAPSPLAAPRVLFVILAVLFASIVAAPSAVATPLEEKRAQAEQLDAEVRELEVEYDELQERWRGARIELADLRADMRQKRLELQQTRRELASAKLRLENRAVDIYQDGGGDSGLLGLAKAGSFSELFERLDAIERVGEQDADIVSSITDISARIARQEAALEKASRAQAAVVKRVNADKQRMGELLAKRQEKLDSVNAEIRAIMEEQRRAAAARAAAEARARAAELEQQQAEPADDGGSDSGSSSSSGGGSSSGGISVPIPPGSSTAAAAASIAMSKIGSPYVWGGSGPDSFDCSGLVMWSFAQAGRPGLPHSTYSLINMGVEVPLDQLQVGDLVFPSHLGHVGLYVGNNSFVHAPSSGDVVKVTSMGDYSIARARRI